MPTDLSIEQRIAYMASDDPYEIYAGNAAAKERVRELMSGHYPEYIDRALADELRRRYPIKLSADAMTAASGRW